MSAPTAAIELAHRVTAADAAFVRRGLLAHNRPFLGESDHTRFAVMARVAGVMEASIRAGSMLQSPGLMST